MAIATSPTLHCSNLDCLAENPGSNLYCHSCGHALLHRYLWVTGSHLPNLSPGEWVDDRYYVISPRVVLDTQPGEVPFCPEEDMPEAMLPYLKLFSYRVFVPQVYGWLSPEFPNCFLLEDAPLYSQSVQVDSSDQASHSSRAGQLLPGLLDSWSGGSLPHQVGWLWQIARLWNVLTRRQVGSTLLDLHSLRVDGPWVRCLELTLDELPPSLLQLGESWTALTAGAHPNLRPLLQQLILFLQTGKLTTPTDLTRFLELALQKVGQYHSYSLELSSHSDAGPSRQSNEDNCFPSNVSYIRTTSGLNSLAVVCDGLGGHEGGEVASHLAVSTLVEDLEASFNNQATIAPEQLLRQAIAMANDAISQQNNQEHREERRRMGTTLVSLLNVGHYFYLANVGDSRSYGISAAGCRQLTVDDDLASRHARMGLGLYRHALEAPSSGALVQALGMVSSQSLVTEIQRFFLSENMLFLLCSDGVSDRDLLEQIWGQELLPILEQNKGVKGAAERIVELANHHNGHDNATAVLIKVNVEQTGVPSADELTSVLKVVSEKRSEAEIPTQIRPDPQPAPKPVPVVTPPPTKQKTKTSSPLPVTVPLDSLDSPSQPPPSKPSQPLFVVWILLLLTIACLLLGAWFFAPFLRSLSTPEPPVPTTTPGE
ncbi:MAG: PP2C family protein-serine/threonine phosphatase [Prochlorotrichaceae cyanobacterium]